MGTALICLKVAIIGIVASTSTQRCRGQSGGCLALFGTQNTACTGYQPPANCGI